MNLFDSRNSMLWVVLCLCLVLAACSTTVDKQTGKIHESFAGIPLQTTPPAAPASAEEMPPWKQPAFETSTPEMQLAMVQLWNASHGGSTPVPDDSLPWWARIGLSIASFVGLQAVGTQRGRANLAVIGTWAPTWRETWQSTLALLGAGSPPVAQGKIAAAAIRKAQSQAIKSNMHAVVAAQQARQSAPPPVTAAPATIPPTADGAG